MAFLCGVIDVGREGAIQNEEGQIGSEGAKRERGRLMSGEGWPDVWRGVA